MGLITWIILGGISGWIVSLIVKTDGDQGILGNIMVGIVGAMIGGFIGTKLFDSTVTGFNISSVVLSVLGGLVFVFVWGLITGKKSV